MYAKKYLAKKRVKRVPRSVSMNYMKARCEHYNDIIISSGTGTMNFNGGTANQNLSFIHCLNSSQTFLDLYGLYVKYKITDVTVTVYRLLGDTTMSGTYPGYDSGLCWLGCYPQLTGNISVGFSPKTKDDVLVVPPFASRAAKKYKFANESISGTQGLGTWNPCTNFGSQIGQFSLSDGVGIATKNLTVFTLRVSFTVLFSELNR